MLGYTQDRIRTLIGMFVQMHIILQTDALNARWLRMLEGKTIKPHPFKHMKGNELTVEWLEHDESAMTEPVLIESPEGLGMKMPGKDFTVRDVAETVGLDTPVEVIGM